MAHLQCNCGNRLSNVGCPNCLEGELKGIYEYKERDVWECSECGRLAVDVKDEKGLTIVKWYLPEDGKPGELFNIGNSKQYEEYLKELWREEGEDMIALGICKVEIK